MTAPRVAHPKQQTQLGVPLADQRLSAELHVGRMPGRTNHFGVHNADHRSLDGDADDDLDDHQEHGFGALFVRVLFTETD